MEFYFSFTSNLNTFYIYRFNVPLILGHLLLTVTEGDFIVKLNGYLRTIGFNGRIDSRLTANGEIDIWMAYEKFFGVATAYNLRYWTQPGPNTRYQIHTIGPNTLIDMDPKVSAVICNRIKPFFETDPALRPHQKHGNQ